MLIYYRTLGIFASIALIYTAITMAVFKLVPITMTLSGIAGFILSIGMVDANILVYERTKEEIKKVRHTRQQLKKDFAERGHLSEIQMLSTMITAGVLSFFTSSFVQGFALSLFIGVILSLFSAITTTRLMLRAFLK